ncbi:tripartite tricarboxylate transporter TctB [Azorhizobium oxalatiphilum]|uniref:Tripartite tricarboxylate transporter TctB n=1 Tax=Azorhizobium oxalatiphilum TaxID=980631 RepID=A0A917FGR6_9HYPH|nr:tripartite tricarboxylate transporter TctB family protein [Azorhizobium oxalatiphilum]GGF83759.1 tripartite tricarboxylate transporter TctB [Azorhizobium oxalatiphilum]
MRVNDLILAIMVIVGGVALAAAASRLPPIPGQAYGAEVFPLLTAVGLILCGFALGAQALRSGAGPAIALGWARERAALMRAAAPVAAVIAYMLLAPRLGFVLATALMTGGLFVLLRVRVVVAIPLAIVVAVITYYSFAYGLRVPLPRGLVEGWL